MQSEIVIKQRVSIAGIVGIWIITGLLYLLPMILFISDSDLLLKVGKYTVILTAIFCMTNIAVRMNINQKG